MGLLTDCGSGTRVVKRRMRMPVMVGIEKNTWGRGGEEGKSCTLDNT